MVKKEGLEIEDVETESYQPEEEMQFSHQALVMRAMQKCLEAGCKEKRAGYFNAKTDKFGNVIQTYVEDTRKVFIESVETVEMIMVCDLDKGAKERIKKLQGEFKKAFDKLCEEELKDWENSPQTIRTLRWKNEIYYREGYLNPELPYYQNFLEEQIRISRKIFKELTKLTKRLSYYREESLQA